MVPRSAPVPAGQLDEIKAEEESLRLADAGSQEPEQAAEALAIMFAMLEKLRENHGGLT